MSPLTEHLTELCEDWGVPVPELRINGRFKSLAGRFRAHNNLIEVGGFVTETYPIEAQLEIVRHEFSHYLEWQYYGHCSGHRDQWKLVALAVGGIHLRHSVAVEDRVAAFATVRGES